MSYYQPPQLNASVPAITPGVLAAGQVQQVEKINRELFVGNTPAGTSELLIKEFLTRAMQRSGLCAPTDRPILASRLSEKFAFIELESSEIANKALNLNGIPFMGVSLKVSRPSKYNGPYVPSKSWQEHTGVPLPAGYNIVAANLPPSTEDRLARELFIGNITPEMTDAGLIQFLGDAMAKVGLTTEPGNPLLACRVSGKYGFIEVRSMQETSNALNLNNIPYMGSNLRVGRPDRYNGILTPHGNWEDILSKYMSGELTLPAEGGTAATAIIPNNKIQPPTNVVMLSNMLTSEELSNEYEEILEDTKEECSTFGSLITLEIPKVGQVGEGKIFLKYISTEDASKAVEALKGRTFDGRRVEAVYFSEEKFDNKDFTE